MEDAMYYMFSALCLGGGLGVIMFKGYVNSAMSMLVSMLGVAGLLLLMQAYFLAFIMIMVYAGAVLVLFVFVVMLIGDKNDGAGWIKKGVLLLLWVAIGAAIGFFEPEFSKYAVSDTVKSATDTAVPALAVAKNYGAAMFTTFMLPFEIAGVLLFAAMVGVIAVAKPQSVRRVAKKELE